ncbi:hypothetical protein TB2_044217 [Malus domestica]
MSDEDIVIVALRGLPPEYNTIKAVIRGRENLVSLKELRSQLKAEETTLEKGFKQPLMTAMYANHSSSMYESGGTSGAKSFSGSPSYQYPYLPGSQMMHGAQLPQLVPMPNMVPMGQVPQPTQFQQLPLPGPYAFVSQTGSGTYNNFRGNNFRYKGKGKKFNAGFQGSTSPNVQSQATFQNVSPQSSSVQSYNPMRICQICDKKGYSALYCFQRGCQICNRVGHTAATCFDRGNPPMSMPQPMYSQQFPASGSQIQHPMQHMSSQYTSTPSMAPQAPSPMVFTARTDRSPSAPRQEYWSLDSGATNHMTSELSNLQASTPYPTHELVTGANGEGLPISHIGQSCITTLSHKLQLNKVLCVPHLSQHLLSMYQLCKDNNRRCIVNEFSVCIQDKVTNKVLFHGLSNNVVYPLPLFKPPQLQPAAYLGQKVHATLWHCRLGHPTNSIVRLALSKSAISLPCNSVPQTCVSCLQGKFTKLPFPLVASKSNVPFKVIHTNVWGPAPVMSMEGHRYYVSFIDECTRYTWIFPMINKAAICDIFIQFHAFIHNFFSVNIKVLQSDGGGEFVGSVLQKFLKTNGILHQMSCPYTPKQNGLAKRKNRHIVETAITLLQQASLPSKFWFHACAITTYLINRMPTPVLKCTLLLKTCITLFLNLIIYECLGVLVILL